MGFSTAITGLKAATTELDVTGNNIANASTVGFKSGRTEFADIFSTAVVGSGSANSPGSGVIVSDIAQDFTAGTIQFTNNTLDLAIDGAGFFQLNDGQGGITYTRAGGFELDKDGNVVSKNGNFLQGFGLDGAGNMQPIGPLAVTQKESPPKATEAMGLSFNIDSRAVASDLPYDSADSGTFTFSTTSRSFDSLGNENTIKFDFIKQGAWRERQEATFDATFGIPGPINAGTDILSFGGATIDAPTLIANYDVALGNPVGTTTQVDANNVAAMLATEFTTAFGAGTWNGDSNIVKMEQTAGAPPKLEVTYKASASDTRPVIIEYNDGTPAGFVSVVESNIENPFFPANHVETTAFSALGAPFSGTVNVGNRIVPIAASNTVSDALDEIIKDTNNILAANPDIDTIAKNGSDLVITYKADRGPAPSFAAVNVASTATGTLTIDPTVTTEIGDNSYEGVYQVHALFNNETALDIGRTAQPGTPGFSTTPKGTEPGPILITFDTTNGLLNSVNGSPVSATGSAPKLTVDGADPADPTNEISLDLSNSTQFASDSIVKSSTQDGYTKGDLIGVTFANDGTMVASFSNGQNSNLGIVALATFENQGGLQPVGDTSWSATLASGQAIVNPPGTGLNGALRSAALEQSNVNLSEQLVKLIEAQRNFQANSKTLQTENAVTQNILQIS